MSGVLSPGVSLLRIDPRTRIFWALSSFFVLLLPLLPLLPLAVKLGVKPSWWLLPVYLLLVAVLAWRHANAALARFGYALLDDGLWLEQGVYWRRASFVPRERVQHTEVSHGPLDRRMGLATLLVHTAGVRLQKLTIPGLSDAQAHALRDALLKRGHAVAGSAPPAAAISDV